MWPAIFMCAGASAFSLGYFWPEIEGFLARVLNTAATR